MRCSNVNNINFSPEGIVWGCEENIKASGWRAFEGSINEIEDEFLRIKLRAEGGCRKAASAASYFGRGSFNCNIQEVRKQVR